VLPFAVKNAPEPAMEKPVFDQVFQEYQDDRNKSKRITQKTSYPEYPHNWSVWL